METEPVRWRYLPLFLLGVLLLFGTPVIASWWDLEWLKIAYIWLWVVLIIVGIWGGGRDQGLAEGRTESRAERRAARRRHR